MIEKDSVVKLNSGGPDMIVMAVDRGFAEVYWDSDNWIYTRWFPVECLTKVGELLVA